jgi:hypothetical protein
MALFVSHVVFSLYQYHPLFDLFKDIFNHLIEKHNAETSKIKKLKFCEKEGVLGHTTVNYKYFLILVFSVSHPVSTQDTNIISKTLAQGMILVEAKYDM